MRPESLFEEVESLEFTTRITVISGFSILLLVLSKDETLNNLKRYFQEHPTQKRQLLSQLLDLLPQNDHPEYMHPFDATITAYLYVLNSVEPGLAHIAIDQIMETPNLFWAYRLAQYLRELDQTKSSELEMDIKAIPVQPNISGIFINLAHYQRKPDVVIKSDSSTSRKISLRTEPIDIRLVS